MLKYFTKPLLSSKIKETSATQFPAQTDSGENKYMLALTRKNQIQDIIMEQKSVTVNELALKFSVTEETIRRDLKSLEETGVLTRTYGGAYIQNGVVNDIKRPLREMLHIPNKQRIARKCAEFIHNGDSIIMDPSTTVFPLCNEIKDKRITVLSDSLAVANFFSECDNIHLISTGGTYYGLFSCFTGRIAQQTIREYFVDMVFLSCRSIDMEHGVTESNEDIAIMHRLQIERAKKVYLLVDHTKFGNVSFVSICGFDKIDAIVTDDILSDEWHTFLERHNVKLYECPG